MTGTSCITIAYVFVVKQLSQISVLWGNCQESRQLQILPILKC